MKPPLATPTIFFFFFNAPATTEIYTVSDTLSLHDALPIWRRIHYRNGERDCRSGVGVRIRSEEHTSELQSPDTISYAVFCLKKKKQMPIFDRCNHITAKIKKKLNIHRI